VLAKMEKVRKIEMVFGGGGLSKSEDLLTSG